MSGEIVRLRMSMYPELPAEVRHIVLTHSVGSFGKGQCRTYLIGRHYAERVQDLMAAHVGAREAVAQATIKTDGR